MFDYSLTPSKAQHRIATVACVCCNAVKMFTRWTSEVKLDAWMDILVYGVTFITVIGIVLALPFLVVQKTSSFKHKYNFSNDFSLCDCRKPICLS